MPHRSAQSLRTSVNGICRVSAGRLALQLGMAHLDRLEKFAVSFSSYKQLYRGQGFEGQACAEGSQLEEVA